MHLIICYIAYHPKPNSDLSLFWGNLNCQLSVYFINDFDDGAVQFSKEFSLEMAKAFSFYLEFHPTDPNAPHVTVMEEILVMYVGNIGRYMCNLAYLFKITKFIKLLKMRH